VGQTGGRARPRSSPPLARGERALPRGLLGEHARLRNQYIRGEMSVDSNVERLNSSDELFSGLASSLFFALITRKGVWKRREKTLSAATTKEVIHPTQGRTETGRKNGEDSQPAGEESRVCRFQGPSLSRALASQTHTSISDGVFAKGRYINPPSDIGRWILWPFFSCVKFGSFSLQICHIQTREAD